MAEVEKSPYENLIAGPSGWPEAYHQLQQLIGARGAIPFLLLAAALFVWWKWEHIEKLPWIKWLIERILRRKIEPVPEGCLSIAVAHLEHDEDPKHETVLLDELRHFEGVEVQPIDRTIKWPAAGSESEKTKKAEEIARGLLKKTRADVLIWGSVISVSDKSAMRLYWTPRGTLPAPNPPESISLPRRLHCLKHSGTT